MKKFLYSIALALVALVPFSANASWDDYVIVLDPGHGGDDPGAVYNRSSVDNYTEAWLALQCASNVYNKLTELGAHVYMTRFENDFDGEINLSPRRAYCYTYGSDVFVSFHLNAANASAHGTETWYYYDGSYGLARNMQNALISKFSEVDGQGGYDMIDRGVKNNGWTVITAGNAYPAVLTESLFVDCYTDWQLIQDTTSTGFYAWVNGHLKGIYDFLTNYGDYSVTEPTYYGGGGGGGSTIDDTPYIAVSDNVVYFNCEAGQTETATVTLKGNKLNGWCYVTPSPKCEGLFTVTPQGLTVDGAPNYNFLDENPTVTITFNPKEAGKWSGDEDGDGYNDYFITLKSVDVDGNDVYQWIALDATATNPPLAFTEQWTLSDKQGNLTSKGWDVTKVRNMAYDDGKLYLVYDHSYIKVVDARTGDFLYDLNNEGVTGGIINLADVRPFDGKIVACNLGGVDAQGNTHDLRIYVWDTPTAAPRVTSISYQTLKDYNITRLGDYIEVGGDWNTIDGSRIIFAYDNYGKVAGVTGGTHIIEFPVKNGSIGTTPSKNIEVKAADGSNIAARTSIRAYPTMYGYMIDGAACPPTKIDADGNRLDFMAGYKTWGNVYRQFDYDGTTYALILDFNDMTYSSSDSNGNPTQTADDRKLNYTGGHMKLLQVNSDDYSYTFFAPRSIANYPAEGLSDTRQNLNCTGNIQLNQTAEGIEVWALSTNQGITYFTVGKTPQGGDPGDKPGDKDDENDGVITGYELKQEWSKTSGHLTANANTRWATGFGGKIYINDHANSRLYYWNESGLNDTGIESTEGTAITSDDAGNIIIPTSMFSAGNTALKVLRADGSRFEDLSLTLPAGITASNMQYMGKAVGDIMSNAGGALFMFPNGSASVVKFVIANGSQKSASLIAVNDVTADAQSIAVPLTHDVNSNVIAVRKRGDRHFFTNYEGAFAPCADNEITTTQGGTVFRLYGNLFAVEPVGAAYCDGFQIVNLMTNTIVARHEAQFSTAAARPNANCVTVEAVDKTTVRLYQYVPGQLAAQYTFAALINEDCSSVAGIAHDRSAMTAAVEGDMLVVSGVNAARIDVYSVAGMQVAAAVASQEVCVSELPTGFYIAKVVDEDGATLTAKFVK